MPPSAQVRTLRKVLDAQAVVTLSGTGFQFGLDVHGELALLHRPATFAPELPAVAVLPFHNLSGNAGKDYFADGIAEDPLTALPSF